MTLICRWLYFIGFYTKTIRRDFCEAALGHGLTGFLCPGKPAVAALEGDAGSIAAFLRTTRTDVFAKVPSSQKKMNLSLLEEGLRERTFAGFEELDKLLPSSGEEGGAGAAKNTGGHKRKDFVVTLIQFNSTHPSPHQEFPIPKELLGER